MRHKQKNVIARRIITGSDQGKGGAGVDDACGVGEDAGRGAITNGLVYAPELVRGRRSREGSVVCSAERGFA